MKKILFSITLLSYAIVITAQDDQKDPNEIKTILANGFKSGGYGGISVGYASVDKRDAVVMGASGAWIINHSLALGMSGTAFISDNKFDNNLQRNANLTGGYGGLLVEPILFAKSPIHVTIPIVIGAGGIAYGRQRMYTNNFDYNNDNYSVEDASPYAFVKPGFELELNMISFMRISLGAYYMQTSKINLMNTSKSALNGLSGAITFKFGVF